MCQIVAQEVAPGKEPLYSSANITVHVIDVNDNSPVFTKAQYTVSMGENVTTGHLVTIVTAHDVDTGLGGKVRYSSVLGYLNTSLGLHPYTGAITVSRPQHGFDREQASGTTPQQATYTLLLDYIFF